MGRLTHIDHQFIEFVPKDVEEGVLYVSLEYNTAVHRCACGCGSKITTPLSPARWQLTYDGEAVSLYPSVGNWSYPCQSHYWIDRGRIEWARKWSREKIERGRARDKAARARYYSRASQEVLAAKTDAEDSPTSRIKRWRRRWRKR